MKRILIALLFLANLYSNAQSKIIGKVIDKETKSPLEFADITISGEQLKYPVGTITDNKGNFEIAVRQGQYTVKVYFVGQELFSRKIEVSNNTLDLKTIEIQNSQELEEVIIISKKKLIQRKIDRLVFNVESSSKSSQGDALEVLKVTPGVRVQNDNISMIGKSNLSVMVNGKILNLPKDEIANFLKTIASENIKNIEVITTPPAKYEASGNSGLVNITLKEAKENSWNAQLKTGTIQRKHNTGTYGGSFAYNKNKFSLVMSTNYRNGIYYQEQDDYSYFQNGLWHTSSPFKAKIKGLNARIDMNYQLSSNWIMGGQYLYSSTDYDVTDQPYTPVYDYNTNEILSYLQSQGGMKLKPEIHSVNYNNEIKLDTLGKKLTLNFDYFNYENPDRKNYNGISVDNSSNKKEYYQGVNLNKQDVKNYSAKLDVEVPTTWANLSFGGKLSSSKSMNNITFFNSGFVENPVTNFNVAKNDFEYNENIMALYASLNKSFNDKWSMQIGARFENTNTESSSNNLDLQLKNNYSKIFPTLYVSYNVTSNSNLSFNYSKRIQRPNFFELNPNIYFVNPFQTIEGNPFLHPVFIDNLELSHTYKNLVSKVYYSYEDDLFSQVPLPDQTTNIIRFTNENFIDRQRFGISENYMFNKIKWWTSNTSFDINYSISKFSLKTNEKDQKGFNTRISTSNDFNLNKDKTLLFGLNYWYSFPGVNGIFDTKSASSLSLSLQFLMLDKNLNLTLRANDIFRDSAERTTTTVNNIYQTARYYYDAQSVHLSVSYKFGNKNIKVKRQATGNKEERGRTGN